MNDDHLSGLWQKVGQHYHVELADALRRRAWSEVTDMRGAEFTEAVRRQAWATVGDEYGMEGAHAIRDAMEIGTEDDMFDAVMDPDNREARMGKIGRLRNQARIDADLSSQDRDPRIGM